ncbi:hypothetical protein [Butyrivibrio sp. INlla16]|uniref:hypothetical protein n=1 Tax=Butyrivibrio sp. INlla16 TaxID=1520807 RepID=UPI001113A949|nr:hypothetical protein [Butyrivibrio sp. INlla16]
MEESAFIDAFAIHLSDKPIDEVQERNINDYITEYLNNKYSDQVKKGSRPDFDGLVTRIDINLKRETGEDESDSGIKPSDLECLTINEQQMRIMYSLEYNKIAYDRDHTKEESDKTRKTEWLIKWANEILKGLGKEDEKGYFYNEEKTFIELAEEYETTDSHNWYFIIMMEQYLFSPYFLFDSSNKKENPWKGLKCSETYVDIICSRQNVVNEKFFKDIKKTYNSSVSYLDEKGKKALLAIGTVVLTSVATFGLSYAFAPAIAVGLVGGGFASLSGQALVNASLAYIGGGALAAGGSGMAGGIALITGGGAIIGAASSGAAAIGSAILASSPEITLRECAKLLTCFERIIIKDPNHRKDSLEIYHSVIDKCEELKDQIHTLEEQLSSDEPRDNSDKKKLKEVIKGVKKSYNYMEKTKDRVQNELLD